MEKLISYLIGFLITISGMAQVPAKKDSLLRLLQHAKEDTDKVLLYLSIGNVCETDDKGEAAQYYNISKKLSEKLNYKLGLIKYYSNYTSILNEKGEFDSALLLNKQSLQLATIMEDKTILGRCNANVGNSFNYIGNYDSALYYYQKAATNFEAIKESYLLARVYEMIQLAYQNTGRIDAALLYGKKALKELRTSGDSIDLGRALLNLANSYQSSHLADSALVCYNEALTIASHIQFKDLELSTLLGMANIYFHEYDADRQKPYAEKALELSRQIENPEGEVIAGRAMALHYLLKNNLPLAKNYILNSLKLADSLKMTKQRWESMSVLSSILYAQKDISGAEKIRDSMQIIEEGLRGDEVQQKMLTLEAKYETEKKEAQIKLQQAQLKQKSILNYLLAFGAAALLVISLLGYRNYRNKQKLQQAKIDELETEKQLTATAAVLKGEEQERTRLAKDLHDGLGGMLSGIKFSLSNMKGNLIMTPDNAQAFERSMDMLDSSIKEMRRVAHNMMPEILLKYGLDVALKEFCNEIERSGAIHLSYHSIDMDKAGIDQTTAVTIYRIVQELVNNAIKHAAAKNVLVQAHVAEQGKLLVVTVEDDGKGFDTTTLKQSAGMGWSNIQNRVSFLKGKADINSQPGKGTSVLIELNI